MKANDVLEHLGTFATSFVFGFRAFIAIKGYLGLRTIEFRRTEFTIA